mmetsp:Transcript_34298/g.105572  ORF Transcript_34298/g.105572 Transcript_34298/m.105572 type:complete len:215 (-) Transcript_34298:24-668(-)
MACSAASAPGFSAARRAAGPGRSTSEAAASNSGNQPPARARATSCAAMRQSAPKPSPPPAISGTWAPQVCERSSKTLALVCPKSCIRSSSPPSPSRTSQLWAWARSPHQARKLEGGSTVDGGPKHLSSHAERSGASSPPGSTSTFSECTKKTPRSSSRGGRGGEPPPPVAQPLACARARWPMPARASSCTLTEGYRSRCSRACQTAPSSALPRR